MYDNVDVLKETVDLYYYFSSAWIHSEYADSFYVRVEITIFIKPPEEVVLLFKMISFSYSYLTQLLDILGNIINQVF